MGFWSGRRIGILTSVDKSSTQPDIKARVFPSANAGEMVARMVPADWTRMIVNLR